MVHVDRFRHSVQTVACFSPFESLDILMGLKHIGQSSFRESLGISQNTCSRRMTASANGHKTVRRSAWEPWRGGGGQRRGLRRRGEAQIKVREYGREPFAGPLSLEDSAARQPCGVCVLWPLLLQWTSQPGSGFWLGARPRCYMSLPFCASTSLCFHSFPLLLSIPNLPPSLRK